MLVSMMTYHEDAPSKREIYIRVKPMEKKELNGMKNALKNRFGLKYSVCGLDREVDKRSV